MARLSLSSTSNGAELVRRSAEQLRQRIESHCRLLGLINEKGGDSEARREGNLRKNYDGPDAQRLRRAIVEAISVLDGTRKCFKSRQLENLRKKLTKALL